MVCSHCGNIRHLIDTCYKLHRYHLHLKQRSANNFTIGEDLDDTGSMISQQEENGSSELTFTLDQKRALLALLQHHGSQQPNHTTNQVTSLPLQNLNSSSVSYALDSHTIGSDLWILDSGAIDHVCHSFQAF